MEDFQQLLQHWKPLINRRLREVLDSKEPAILYEPISYVIEGGGKRIRPILLLLACQAVGGRLEDAWDAALAVELLHNFTLVHDDIMDRDETRRGRATVHKKWDTDVALLAGDGLVALAYQCLLRSRTQRINEISTIFTNGIVKVCEGQALDREFESRQNVSLEEYLDMIEKKTATLLKVAATIGAIIGEGEREHCRALGDFGLNLGRAFQIQDDLLDVTAEEKILGKTLGSDVMRRKQTYLLVHALNHADAANKMRIHALLSRPLIDRSVVSEMRSIFESVGSIEAAKRSIAGFISSAEKNLTNLPQSSAKHALRGFLDYIENRNA